MNHLPLRSPEGNPIDSGPNRNRHAYQTQTWERLEPPVDLKTYRNIMKRRKRLILTLLTILFPLVALGFCMRDPTYEATATLFINPATPQFVHLEEVVQPDTSPGYYQAQYDLMRSRALVERVIDTLRTQQGAQVSQQEQRVSHPGGAIKHFVATSLRALQATLIGSGQVVSLDPAEVERRHKIATLQQQTRVEPVGTRLVDVTVSGPEPYEIADQANTLARIYVKQNLERKRQAAQRARAWLAQEATTLKAGLQQAELALQNFIEARGLIPADLDDNQQNVALRALHEWASAFAALKSQRVDLEIQLNEIGQLVQRPVEQLPSLGPMVDNTLIEHLWQRHTELEVQMVELSRNFKTNHPGLDHGIGHFRPPMTITTRIHRE